LLRKLLGESRVDRELVAAKAICEYLGYLPLGVELAGRYLQLDEDLRLGDYRQRLKISDESLDLQESEEINATRGVIAAFELSWQELSAGTGKVAMLLGLFAPADIAWGLVEEVAAKLGHKKDRSPIKALLKKVFSYFQQNQMSFNKQELEKAKKDLNNLYLIKAVDEDRSRFAVHSLTRQFLQWKLAQEPDTNRLFRETFVMSLLDIAKQMPQSPTRDLIASVAPAIPHLDMLSRAMLDDIPNPEENYNLFWAFTGIARFYDGQGLYALAEDPYQRCLDTVKKILGDRHPDVATSLGNLAGLYESQGRYEAAEPLYLQALSLRREILGDRHPDVATSLNNLALLYKSQGKYEAAEPLYQQALSLRREILGDRHPNVAQSLNNLAGLYESQGRYDEAEPLYQQALSLYRELLGDRHPLVAGSLNNLALLYSSQGRYEAAEPLYLQALSLRQELLGDGHPSVADSLLNLAALYYNTQRYSEALQSIQLAIQIYKQKLGTEHPTTQAALSWLQLIQNAM
ncbi:MAG: tetratricopeptide repeat protein, partial [Pseudanabaena sp.]